MRGAWDEGLELLGVERRRAGEGKVEARAAENVWGAHPLVSKRWPWTGVHKGCVEACVHGMVRGGNDASGRRAGNDRGGGGGGGGRGGSVPECAQRW